MKVLFIIPAYNEGLNISKVIEEIRKDVDYAEILIVNDCSKDNTLEVIKNSNVEYLSLPLNLGYSGALQTGFKYAVEYDYDYVIQFDGDGQHIAKEAEKLLNHSIENKLDIVIGSRFKGETSYNHSFFRSIGTRVFQNIIELMCKKKIFDPTSGFQVLSRRVFEKYSRKNEFPDYPDANLIIEMLFMGYKIEEMQVEMREREFGTSMHSGILKPMKYVIKMLYSIIILWLKNFTTKDYRIMSEEVEKNAH